MGRTEDIKLDYLNKYLNKWWIAFRWAKADRKELITLSGIELNGINSLFSIANSPINSPLSAYTLLKTDGS